MTDTTRLNTQSRNTTRWVTTDVERAIEHLGNITGLNDGFEYGSYITTATIEVGLKDNGQGIAAMDKGLMDNDHSNHQKEGTSRAQVTEASPV